MWMILIGAFSGLLGVIPTILKSIIELVTPLLKILVDLFVAWLKACWEGLKDVLDNWATVVFVVSLLLAIFTITRIDSKFDCKQEKTAITKQLSKKQPVTKQPDWKEDLWKKNFLFF